MPLERSKHPIRQGLRTDGKPDRTHDPKPTSGWWADSERHRIAAQKNNSNGGLGAGSRKTRQAVSFPGRTKRNAAAQAGKIQSGGSRRKG